MSSIRTLGGIAAAAPPVVGGFPANTKHNVDRDNSNRLYVDGGEANNALRAQFNGKTAVTLSTHVGFGVDVGGEQLWTVFLGWANGDAGWAVLIWYRGRPGRLEWMIQDPSLTGADILVAPNVAGVGYETASHIVADADLTTGAANIYVNDMVTPVASGTLSTISAFAINAGAGGAGLGSYGFRTFGTRGIVGYVCQTGLWDRVLNQTERELLYSGADAISIPSGCMGAWRVDGDGDYSVDDSGNGNYLTKLGNQDLIATTAPPYV